MSRRFRLSVHRKNEFRKKYAKQRGYNVTVSPSFPVQIPLNLVSLRSAEQSTSSPSSQEPLSLSVSIPLDVVEQVNFNTIHNCSKRLQVIPKGTAEYVYVLLLIVIDCLHLGWIEVACDPNKSISFLKLDSNEAGDFRLVLSLKVNYHGTWEVSVTNVSLNSKEFSNFPELVVTLSDLKLILSSLDDMVICCGNNDTKFEELVLLKKGVFMDQSGMYALLHTVATCTYFFKL